MSCSPLHSWADFVGEYSTKITIDNPEGNMRGCMLCFSPSQLALFVQEIMERQVQFEGANRLSQLGILQK